MKKSGRRAALLLLSMVSVTGVIKGTMAYFTDTETKVNVFTMGDLDLGLTEPEWDPDPEGGSSDGSDMYPGYTVYKNPTIKNITSDKNGAEPCYARIRINIRTHSGEAVKDERVLEMISQMIYFDGTFTGTYDKKGSASGLIEGRSPGYSLKDLEKYHHINPIFVKDEKRSLPSSPVYNYMGTEKDGILDIGEEATLFTTIVIPTDWNQTHLSALGDFRLDIEAECIQCSGFTDQEAAFCALDEEASGAGLLQRENN